MSARWLFEDGIGETRALRHEGGRVVEARIERDDGGLRTGAVVEGRLGRRMADGRRALLHLADADAVLQPVPSNLAEGTSLRAEVVREAMRDPAAPGQLIRTKPARLRPVADDTPLRDAPTLLERIGGDGVPVERCTPVGADRLAESGWHDILQEAEQGLVAFPGGRLLICPTPALTAIDVDGEQPPRALALAAAEALGAAIRRLGLAGLIVADFPTLESKADRAAVVEAFDAAMTIPCERSAISGFGVLQIAVRRERPSLVELVQADPALTSLLAKLRAAEREPGTGPLALALDTAEAARLERRPDWRAALERRTGRPLALDPAPHDPRLPA